MNVTCPNCRNEFHVQNARVALPEAPESPHQDSLSVSFPGWPSVLALVPVAAIAGVLSSGISLVGFKGFLPALLWVPMALVIIFVFSHFLLSVTLGKQARLYRGSCYLLVFVCLTIFFHSLWYAHDNDDSRIERPVVSLHKALGLQHTRSAQSRILMLQARDALLANDFLQADEALKQLATLYPGKPDRFYYYHAYVYHKLGEPVAADLNARRYLKRVSVEGRDFAAAQAEFERRLNQ